MVDSVVKIDGELLDSVEEFISRDENKYKFVNRKQFIDIAVNDYLKECERKSKRKSKRGRKK